MKKINIIGAGKAGSTLAIIFNKNPEIRLGAICDYDPTKLSVLYDKINADDFITSAGCLPDADIHLITTPDDLIISTCDEIIKSQLIKTKSIFAHCSGTIASSSLCDAVNNEHLVASVHPVKSFASPEHAAKTFSGTYCGFEGDYEAVDLLKSIFARAGAYCFDIDPEKKSLYHAAAVLSCNYLNTLIELGITTYGKAGVNREIASNIIETIAKDTLCNIFNSSPSAALTGPISRGDVLTITKHLDAFVEEGDEQLLAAYKLLGLKTVALAREQGNTDKESLDKINEILGV